MTGSVLPPYIYYFAGALLLPLLPGRFLKRLLTLAVPIVGFIALLQIPKGSYDLIPFLNYHLTLMRVDKLSLIFSYVFVIMSFIGAVYALHIKEEGQMVAAFLYVGSTLGVTFAGDYFSLFFFWEIMAGASVFLIWYNRTEASVKAGYRYLLVHIAGGCLLLAGILLQISTQHSIAFNPGSFGSFASYFILAGFLVNAAVPPFHPWLPDAYPMGTITGSVFLTAYTTKSAVYVLCRGFAGAEVLMWLGAIMAIYGVVYAFIEVDMRKLLSYHIVSQVGYMVCGVGIGTELALNGSTAHAFCHILYKALLFMACGAVIHVTGKRKLTELSGKGLFKIMPFTLVMYMIAAFSISAVPLFNGFISKSMVVAAAGEAHHGLVELMLHLASIGTFLSVGLKLPYFAWFGKPIAPHEEEKLETGKLPLNMKIAMGIAGFLCIALGVYPDVLYRILPFQAAFHPFAYGHVVKTMGMLLFTLLAFLIYLPKISLHDRINLDTDWFYRMGAKLLYRFVSGPMDAFYRNTQGRFTRQVDFIAFVAKNPYTAPTLLKLGIQHYIASGFGVLKNVPDLEIIDTHFKDLSKKTYSDDSYRRPVGIGVMLSILFLSIFVLIYMLR